MTKFQQPPWVYSRRGPMDFKDALRTQIANASDHPDFVARAHARIDALEEAFISLAAVVFDNATPGQQNQLLSQLLPCWEKVDG